MLVSRKASSKWYYICTPLFCLTVTCCLTQRALCCCRLKTGDQRQHAGSSTGSTGALTWGPFFLWVVWPTSSKISASSWAISSQPSAWGFLSWCFSWAVPSSSLNLLMAVPSQTCSRSWALPAALTSQRKLTCYGESRMSFITGLLCIVEWIITSDKSIYWMTGFSQLFHSRRLINLHWKLLPSCGWNAFVRDKIQWDDNWGPAEKYC